MTNIINAEFRRLFKNKFFYIALVLSFLVPFAEMTEEYLYYKRQNRGGELGMQYDYNSMMNLVIFPFLIAVFVSLFIGKDFHDGTIRNKIAVGNKRGVIYFSELAVCSTASVLFQAVGFFSLYVFANAYFHDNILLKEREELRGAFVYSLPELLKFQLFGMIIILGYTALCLLVAVTLSSRTRAVIVSLVLVVISISFGESVQSSVYPIETEMEAYDYYFPEQEYNLYEMTEEEQEQHWKEVEEKEKLVQVYVEEHRGSTLSGVQKTIYLVCIDTLAYCQILQVDYNILFESGLPSKIPTFVLYDIIFFAVFNVIGVLIFSKKDLK